MASSALCPPESQEVRRRGKGPRVPPCCRKSAPNCCHEMELPRLHLPTRFPFPSTKGRVTNPKPKPYINLIDVPDTRRPRPSPCSRCLEVCEPIDPPDARVIGVYNPMPAKPSRAQTSQIMLTRLGGAGRFILPGPICNYVLVTVM